MRIYKPTWAAPIALVFVAIIVVRSAVEWYLVNVNLAGTSHQSGWQFVQVAMQVPIIYVTSTLLAALAHSWSRIKISSLKIFFISSQVIMASMWLFIMISVIIAY